MKDEEYEKAKKAAKKLAKKEKTAKKPIRKERKLGGRGK
ncbi:MAG: hypothetical protein Ta2G_14980 [Termitinemataceae bacterium]|nr:MAG: hypothetical protein Ta2G_14980 [Termitinemataceae bacterium]